MVPIFGILAPYLDDCEVKGVSYFATVLERVVGNNSGGL